MQPQCELSCFWQYCGSLYAHSIFCLSDCPGKRISLLLLSFLLYFSLSKVLPFWLYSSFIWFIYLHFEIEFEKYAFILTPEYTDLHRLVMRITLQTGTHGHAHMHTEMSTLHVAHRESEPPQKTHKPFQALPRPSLWRRQHSLSCECNTTTTAYFVLSCPLVVCDGIQQVASLELQWVKNKKSYTPS